MSIPYPDVPVGGRLHLFSHFWSSITSDRFVLQTVAGLHLDFFEEVYQNSPALQLKFSLEEEKAADEEIRSLLLCGAIIESVHEEGEFISNVFLRPKKTGGFRMILNLKKLNKFIRYNKFKMETSMNILNLIEEGCFQTSVDFESAYLMVAIHPKYQKYLKFYWKGVLYK